MPRSPAPDTREARLKAALKANMGRRKGQARARSEEGAEAASDHTDTTRKDSQDG